MTCLVAQIDLLGCIEECSRRTMTFHPPVSHESSWQDTECHCCSNNHLHPETGEELICDRALVFGMLRKWFGASKGEKMKETYLDPLALRAISGWFAGGSRVVRG